MALLRFSISTAADVAQACREARHMARELSFSCQDAEVVALAVSELATNLVRYAMRGQLVLESVANASLDGLLGMRVCSDDHGPGISNLARALQDGYSTGGGLGGGLPGVRRLMDTFEMRSDPAGTHIVACKWPTIRS